jgi:hypothetical protein
MALSLLRQSRCTDDPDDSVQEPTVAPRRTGLHGIISQKTELHNHVCEILFLNNLNQFIESYKRWSIKYI